MTAFALLFFGLLILVIGLGVSLAGDPLEPLAGSREAEEDDFCKYVARELRKAEAGAANAEQWAKDLVAHWSRRQPLPPLNKGKGR